MTTTVKVEVVNISGFDLPKYETKGAAGLDLRVMTDGAYSLRPGETKLFKTGLFVAIPEGYELQVRSRSGVSLKQEIVILNSPGTIDSDYRGEIGLIIHNMSQTSIRVVNHGDRLAQAVLKKVEKLEWIDVAELSSTDRGIGGYGSTGK